MFASRGWSQDTVVLIINVCLCLCTGSESFKCSQRDVGAASYSRAKEEDG